MGVGLQVRDRPALQQAISTQGVDHCLIGCCAVLCLLCPRWREEAPGSVSLCVRSHVQHLKRLALSVAQAQRGCHLTAVPLTDGCATPCHPGTVCRCNLWGSASCLPPAWPFKCWCSQAALGACSAPTPATQAWQPNPWPSRMPACWTAWHGRCCSTLCCHAALPTTLNCQPAALFPAWDDPGAAGTD